MAQAPDENLKNPFSDEFEPQGERYIEKFQDVLNAHHEPPLGLLDSLQEQSTKTLQELKTTLQTALENAEPAHAQKYQLALQAIEEQLGQGRA